MIIKIKLFIVFATNKLIYMLSIVLDALDVCLLTILEENKFLYKKDIEGIILLYLFYIFD